MSRTVLVVDDDLDLRVALEEVLTDAGYHAVLAQSAEHALQLLDTVSRPCLVLLDYAMPGAGAEGFLSAIQERADAESFSVVLMTGRPAQRLKMPRLAAPPRSLGRAGAPSGSWKGWEPAERGPA